MRKISHSIVTLAMIAAGFSALSGNAEASTLKTLYSFCSQANCADGVHPVDALTLGPDGTIYGIAYTQHSNPYGTVFALIPNARKTKYKFKQIYVFCLDGTCPYGQNPTGRLVIDTAGNLYGAAMFGGANGSGTVFELMPRGVKWAIKLLHEFCPGFDCSKGSFPKGLAYAGEASGQAYDGTSTLYGITSSGGKNNKGAVFTLTRKHGEWNERAVTSFDVPAVDPSGTPSLDLHGNVFVPTLGPFDGGAVTESSPLTGRKWVMQTIYTFGGGSDGQDPSGALAFDDQDRVFGVTQHGGDPTQFEPGNIYRLTPNGSGWSKDLLHTFCPHNCAGGKVPSGGVAFDASGRLVGTAIYGGGNDGGGGYDEGGGVIFRIDRNGNSFEKLYAFCAKPGCTDGAYPVGLPVMDKSGTLYGTTEWGGNNGGGTVYSFVP